MPYLLFRRFGAPAARAVAGVAVLCQVVSSSPAARADIASVPAVPTNVSISNAVAANAGITGFITWTAPSNSGGHPISAFSATVNPGGLTCATRATSTSAAGTTCRVFPLAARTAYTATVTATNLTGTSAASAPSAAVRFDAPAAPTGVSAAPGDRAVTVGWVAPANTGGVDVTGYRVLSSPDQRGCFAVRTARQCVVKSLRNGVPYTFTVTASNLLGVSPASDPSARVVPVGPPPAPPPAAPAGLSATMTFGSSGKPTVRLSWTAEAATGMTTRIAYANVTTAPLSPAQGLKTTGKPAPPLPGDTGPRWSAAISGAAVRSPLAISVFMINAAGHASAASSVVLIAASVAIAKPAPARSGAVATVKWQLRNTGGTPLDGVRVTILFRSQGVAAWQVRSLVTNAGGWATLRMRFDKNTELALQYAGDRTHLGVRNGPTILRVAHALSANLTRTRARARSVVRLSGVVLPAKRSQPIYLQVLAGTIWRSVAVMRVDAKGAYSFVVPTTGRGVRRYRVYCRGDSFNIAGASGQRILTVV